VQGTNNLPFDCALAAPVFVGSGLQQLETHHLSFVGEQNREAWFQQEQKECL
jgi:hypothetical protein